MSDASTSEMHGLLVVDKPAGWTSHDVVAKVRRLTGVRRVGHAGTLDPAATGVLPLGVGQGTRVLDYLAGADKSYRGTLRLGRTTDTDDAEGVTLEERDWSRISPEDVRAALGHFTGEISQVPPAYSAIKRGGVPLHRLARAGAPVRPEPRRVRIDRIDVLDVRLPDVTFEVECSKGTYIRSLARDVGEALGCGAHLVALRRLRTGPFTLTDAHTLEEISVTAESEGLPAMLLPLDTPLLGAPAMIVGAEDETRILTGRSVAAGRRDPGVLARAYAADGAFLAVVRAAASGWIPEKVFG